MPKSFQTSQLLATTQRGLPIEVKSGSTGINPISAETVQLYYSNAGVRTIDAGQAIGVAVSGSLANRPVMNSDASMQASALDTSLTFTSTAFTTEVAFPEIAIDQDDKSWDSRLAQVVTGFTNGQYCVDYSKGILYGKKASTQTTLTSTAYSVLVASSAVSISSQDAILVDDSAFTPSTSNVNVAGFFADETATDSVDEGDTGAARMTLDRKQITASEQKEDSVFADASYLSLGGQEIDDPTALATMTEGDVGNFKGDLSGRQIVTLGTLAAGENLTDNLVQVAMRPIATATNTYSRDSSTALEASSISKASAGNLYRAFGVIDATAATDIYYIQFLDSATLTADGAVTHLITPIPVNHTTGTDSSFDTGHFDAGIAATSGIVIVASTTMVLKTIAGSVLFATVLFK